MLSTISLAVLSSAWQYEMDTHPFPHIEEKSKIPLDGAVLETPEYCYIADREKCQEYYGRIENKNGFHTCPYGFSSYVDNEKDTIYTGLRVSGEYDREKLKNKEEEDEYIPTIPKSVIKRSMDNYFRIQKDFDRAFEELDKVKKESNEVEEFVDSILHEIRNFNRDIKFYAEKTDRVYEGKDKVRDNIKRINALAHLISIRLKSYDIEKNPDVITSSGRYPKVVHKKFYKAKKILGRKGDSEDVKIKLLGESTFEWPMYDIFDIVPFILLDNAIKYSPPNQDVEVVFDNSTEEHLRVKAKSIGPKIEDHEIKRVLKRKERGDHASDVDESGGGYGLYLAKTICNIHDVDLEIYSGDRKTTLDNVPYSDFCVTLSFDRRNI